jgi:hypothetical protein
MLQAVKEEKGTNAFCVWADEQQVHSMDENWGLASVYRSLSDVFNTVYVTEQDVPDLHLATSNLIIA